MRKTEFEKTGGSRCKRKCQKYRQRIALPMKIKYVFFYCSRIDFHLFVQTDKQQAVRLSSDCVNGKYLWALPTPTTFKKVDQTFIIAWLNCELNHNLSQLLIKNLLPNFFCNFLYKCEFSPLLFFGEFVADFA